jgi:hypothetical protein
MSKTITMKIGGHDFRIQRLGAFDALEIGGNLQRVFGPAIAATAGLQGKEAGALQNHELSSILMDSAEALGRYLDGPTLKALVQSLITQDCIFVKAKGSKEYVAVGADDIEDYIEDVAQLLDLTSAVLKHNFTELFRKAFALFGKLPKQSNTTTKATEATDKPSEDPLDD